MQPDLDLSSAIDARTKRSLLHNRHQRLEMQPLGYENPKMFSHRLPAMHLQSPDYAHAHTGSSACVRA